MSSLRLLLSISVMVVAQVTFAGPLSGLALREWPHMDNTPRIVMPGSPIFVDSMAHALQWSGLQSEAALTTAIV